MHIRPMIGLCALLAVIGCFPTEITSVPRDSLAVAPESQRAGFHVTPTGTPDGNGTVARPWDLRTALNQPPAVRPGDTIWLHGGRYATDSQFVSRLNGTAGAPIVVRQYPGERATIDGSYRVRGSHSWHWGFEIMYSDLRRVSTQTSSWTDVPRSKTSVAVDGPHNRMINLVIHDVGTNFFAGVLARGLELYGCLIYNGGWNAADRAHGHGIYLQNDVDTMRVVDNVIYNNFFYGMQIYSGTNPVKNFWIEGNSVFGSATQVGTVRRANLYFLGPTEGGTGYSTIIGNSFQHNVATDKSLQIGDGVGGASWDITLHRNTVFGGTTVYMMKSGRITSNRMTVGPGPELGTVLSITYPVGQPFSALSVDSNHYAAGSATGYLPLRYAEMGAPVGTSNHLPEWTVATGYDVHGSEMIGAFPGFDVIIRPNKYERGRAWITVWNWRLAPTASLDLSAILRTGDRYEVRHAYDVFGAPVAAGTFSGSTVTVPTAGYRPPTAIGMTTTPRETGPLFNVFLVTIP